MQGAVVNVLLGVVSDAEIDLNFGDLGYSVRLLLEGLVVDSEGSDGIEVDGDRGHLHVSQVEGLRQFFHLAVFSEKTASIKIHSSSVESL
mgnify:CR=1 FL=1